VVEAAWDSPSGHRITAEYRGTVDDGTLTLSSDPPLTQDQVLNVVLFDDPEGGIGDEEAGSGQAASALATTVTTSGLGRALSDLSNLEISAGVDTSEPDNARPEVGVRLSPRWSIGVQYNPEGGSDALSRHPDRALLSVRARISRRWSVESTVGDGGTSILDLMWRYHH
jgi:autotransporter translocation and assembly factor TamB